MSTRRPRIKASANLALASKRKSKASTDSPAVLKPIEESAVKVEKIIKTETEDPVQEDESTTTIAVEKAAPTIAVKEAVSTIALEEPKSTVTVEKVASSITEEEIGSPIEDPAIASPLCDSLKSPTFVADIYNGVTKTALKPFEDAFKYPQNPDYKRPSAVVHMEENTASDFEDNILHMDLQKSPGFPMSPTKSRQRIKPTPIFGQRRNSFVGTSPSPHTEDETVERTRQRSSNSTSSDVPNSFIMRKLAAGNLGRIRTESGCSTVSESRGLSRKYANDEHRNMSKREYQNRFNRKVLDKSSLKMFDLIYYNPTTNPMEQRSMQTIQSTDNPDTPPDQAVAEGENAAEPTAPEPGPASAMPVPQLKLGSNGEMMIDEKSLEIETTAEVEARKVLANSSLIYHDENTGSEGFYRKHKRTKDWLPDETIKFYRCLQTVGTDFSLMLTLFPNRTRRDLKLKFKKEERSNLALVNKALLYPGTFNIEELKEQLDAEDSERREQERLWQEIKAKEAKQIKKLRNAPSSSSRILVSGDEIYQNENVTKGKLSKRSVSSVSITQPKQKKPRTRDVPLPPRSSNSVDDNVSLEREINDILVDPSIVSGDTMDSLPDSGSLNEASINLILSELANGTLALVSSADPANPEKVFNEIYILCKETGQLSDKPLDLPEEIVDSIRSVISS